MHYGQINPKHVLELFGGAETPHTLSQQLVFPGSVISALHSVATLPDRLVYAFRVTGDFSEASACLLDSL